MSSPQKTDEQLMSALLKELGEFRELKDEVKSLSKDVNKLSVLEQKIITAQKEIDRQQREIDKQQKYVSDIRELKSRQDDLTSEVLLLDSKVTNHARDINRFDEEITGAHRISNLSLSNEIELEKADALAKKEIKKERNTQIVKIIFSVIAAIVSFIVGHFLK